MLSVSLLFFWMWYVLFILYTLSIYFLLITMLWFFPALLNTFILTTLKYILWIDKQVSNLSSYLWEKKFLQLSFCIYCWSSHNFFAFSKQDNCWKLSTHWWVTYIILLWSIRVTAHINFAKLEIFQTVPIADKTFICWLMKKYTI